MPGEYVVFYIDIIYFLSDIIYCVEKLLLD